MTRSLPWTLPQYAESIDPIACSAASPTASRTRRPIQPREDGRRQYTMACRPQPGDPSVRHLAFAAPDPQPRDPGNDRLAPLRASPSSSDRFSTRQYGGGKPDPQPRDPGNGRLSGRSRGIQTGSGPQLRDAGF
ncbi:hypothetical protein EJ03DRAFT_327016 [Teratosphaeria nubilosa]|uniref:Uncharacterized protein n=1 Tax=Teratosphaeria nubilosa TaxID=161662 RepID=A0A6G1LCC9_9PEZI|nr:hypothetical protein EJ03DRAFT_327016 [Teratosphaeria nubilosa]